MCTQSEAPCALHPSSSSSAASSDMGKRELKVKVGSLLLRCFLWSPRKTIHAIQERVFRTLGEAQGTVKNVWKLQLSLVCVCVQDTKRTSPSKKGIPGDTTTRAKHKKQTIVTERKRKRESKRERERESFSQAQGPSEHAALWRP